jgi:hypothetical protein
LSVTGSLAIGVAENKGASQLTLKFTHNANARVGFDCGRYTAGSNELSRFLGTAGITSPVAGFNGWLGNLRGGSCESR